MFVIIRCVGHDSLDRLDQHVYPLVRRVENGLDCRLYARAHEESEIVHVASWDFDAHYRETCFCHGTDRSCCRLHRFAVARMCVWER